jgi:hypothetical protein
MKTAVVSALVVLLLCAAAAVKRVERNVAIGSKATVANGDGVAIGNRAEAKGFPGVSGETAEETIAIGGDAKAEGWRCSAVGARARAGVVSATALGRGTLAWGPHMIAIGRGALMERVKESRDLNVSNACGISGDSLWLGGRMAHKMIDRTGDSYIHEKQDGGDGKSRWDVSTSPPQTYTIHGMDAYDARFDQDPERFQREVYDENAPASWKHREEKDVAGGSLHIAAGRGTGTADGGAIEFQTAPAGTVSQNRKNALKTAVKFDTNYAAENATPMLLWDNQAKTLKRVMVGPPDSGGPGFRALVIAN